MSTMEASVVGAGNSPRPRSDVSMRQLKSLVLVEREPAIPKNGLPHFSFGRYWKTVKAGARIKEWRVVRKRAEYREERDRNTAMFVTPGLPPLAMPPIVESSFWEEEVKSDLLHQKLFPNDVVSQARMKDLDGEFRAIWYYSGWLHQQVADGAGSRQEFYVGLQEEVECDYLDVLGEVVTLRNRATPLALFEFLRLDQDGGTTHLVEDLECGVCFDDEDDEEVQAHYGHILREYPKLWRFEKKYSHILGSEEGVRKHWDKARLIHVLSGHGDETWKKYSHLLDLFDESTEDTSDPETEASNDGSQDDSDRRSSGVEDEAEQLREISPSAWERARN